MNNKLGNIWKHCNICKKGISLGATYYLCSVSTCRGGRTGYVFCSLPCWDGHLGFANHKTSYAEEMTAPLKAEASVVPTPPHKPPDEPASKRRIIIPEKPAPIRPHDIKVDTLVVVSKVKQLIQGQSEFNTSQCAIDALTTKVVETCLNGIEHAKTAGRKTVMGRDIK